MRIRLARLVTAAWLLAAFTACEPERGAVTQAIVTVSADGPVSARLQGLKVLLYPLNTLDERAPWRVERLALVETDAARTYRLPLSFGILRERAEQVELVIKGCADYPECADVVVEQKHFVRFQRGKTIQVAVLLSEACIGAAARCTGLRQTCAPTSNETLEAGSCTATELAIAQVVQPGEERFPVLPDSPPKDAGDTDAIADEQPSDSDGGDPGADDGGLRCPSESSCRSDYPCLPDDGQGYVCRGQLADWPMPDSLPGAANSTRYDTTTTEGVVRDLVTGLDWQQRLPDSFVGCRGALSVPGDSCTWSEAQAYCASLALADLRWRLPTKIELESLLDFRPSVDTLDSALFFVTSGSAFYWTGSPRLGPDPDSEAFTVEFGDGHTSWRDKRSPLPVRCVHSNDRPPHALPSRYVPRSAEGVIGDARTGLVWSSLALCDDALSFEDAQAYCAGLPRKLRLPSAKELLTLIDPTLSSPAVDPTFAGTPTNGYFWSTTPTKRGSGQWLVGSAWGESLTDQDMRLLREWQPEVARPRCVRCVQ